MIKINLANSLIAKSGASKSVSMQVNPKQLAIKLALLVLPLLGVIYWEKVSIQEKQTQLASTQAEAQKLTTKLESYGSIDDMVRNVNEQKKDLDDKFSVMRQIFNLRSQKIQTLLELKAQVPENTWLTQVSFQERTVSVTGYAASISEVQAFASGLSSNTDLFAAVNTANTVSEVINNGDFFKFDIFIKLKE